MSTIHDYDGFVREFANNNGGSPLDEMLRSLYIKCVKLICKKNGWSFREFMFDAVKFEKALVRGGVISGR